MVAILVIGLVMSLISAIFWCIEAADFIKAVKLLKVPDSKNPIVRVGQFIAYVLGFVSALPKLWKLGVDVLVTIVLSTSFGMGRLLGSILGLTISNVISVYLLFVDKQKTIEGRTV